MVDVDVAFLDSRNWVEEDMLERMRWLRQNDPLHWSEKDGLWLASKYEDVAFVSKNQGLFTSEHGVRPTNPTKIGLIDEGEPRHGELRALINKGFTPRMVSKLERTFRYLTTKAIDAIASEGQCDFVESIAVPLPLWIIAAMIGIPEEDYDRFHQWSDAMIAADGNLQDPEIAAKAGQSFVEYATYVTPLIEDRRRNPQDDLLSILAGAKDDGLLKRYDEQHRTDMLYDEAHLELANDELIKLLVILLVAGNETTRNGISGGMQLLIENPEERDKLIHDPSLIKSAVEEMVRVSSPVRSFARTVTRDTELRGRKLEVGQEVLLLYPSANRDEEVFRDADSFLIERNAPHLGFGIGSHFCLGANLARMEMRVVFEELLRRLPDIDYAADGPRLRPSALVRSCVEMKICYTPEGQVADAA